MKFSDETLMAYADDELDDETRAAIEAQMRTDPQVAQEVARHQALRAKLRGAFGSVLAESVPERLTAAAHTAPAGSSASIVSLSAARDARSGVTPAMTVGRWSAPHWFAIAASLVIGVIGTRLALMSDSGPIVADNGRMIASGTLAAALSTQVGAGLDAAPVQIGISFLAKSGDYCRTFNVGDEERLAGLACREGDQWRVKALAQENKPGDKPAGDRFRMAASALPPAILRAVEDSISGEALDSAGEAMARQRDWKK